MDFGYHNASFVYHDDPDERSLVDSLTARAQFVEDAGFSWYTLMDHFWQLSGVGYHDEPFVECYTGLSALAEATDEMELSALVTCVHYRNPAFLAKTVASLDSLSEGRAVLAIGAGWYEDEYDAAGLAFADAETRILQTRDAIDLCKAAWNEESPVNFEGDYYELDDLYLNPKPDDVPVLVGGGGEHLTLQMTADKADRWNLPGAEPERYEHKLDVLEGHCEDLGRDFDDIELTITLTACIREDSEDAHEAYEDLQGDTPRGAAGRDEFRGLVGSPAEAAEIVETYRELGADTLQIQPPKNDRRTTELFVDEVAPQF
ncbi:MAG: LLM class flavin-dependent oxidoreductase [Halobacteriaceae archaeon]